MEEVTEMFGIGVDRFDSGHEVTRVALHENGIFGVVVVLILGRQSVAEKVVVGAGGVEDETARKVVYEINANIACQRPFGTMSVSMFNPPSVRIRRS